LKKSLHSSTQKNNTLPYPHFTFYNKQHLLNLTRIRKFETKLGERIQYLAPNQQHEAALKASNARFVIIGIPEDIGVRANLGTGGADSAWQPFLSAFLNIQSNDFLSGEEILVLGHFDFQEMRSLIESNAHDAEELVIAYRHAVHTIDEEVEALIKLVTSSNKTPVIIGGGHNNAYPLIKGAAKGLHKAGLLPLAQINAVNLDAHTDYRPIEGRHSGNAFRYADEDGYLQKYCVIGVHENYIPQNVWVDIVNNPFIDLITYEDIFIHEKRSFMQAVAHAAGFTDDTHIGVELDLDCIEDVLSSAITPAGISAAHARQYINFVTASGKAAYLHICEGATKLTDGKSNETTGKLVSYLVSDFMKAHES
jgi:formiminoglutamase